MSADGDGAQRHKATVRACLDLIGTLPIPQNEGANSRAFSRGGPLSPALLLGILLFMVGDARRRGYQRIIDAFWDEAHDFGLPTPSRQPVSDAAFCKARRKLPPELIRKCLHQVADRFDSSFGSRLRPKHGRRVFAVDGSKMNVQRGSELSEAFGAPSRAYSPQMLVSTLFDVTTKVPYDLVVGPYATSERDHLSELLPRLHRGDILVLDRGYPSFEVFWMLQDAGIDFVIRVPSSSTFIGVMEFLESDSNDSRIVIDRPVRKPTVERGPIEVRAVRVRTPDREETVMLTSLSRSDFSRNAIRDLYRQRWEIEEHFKLAKSDYFSQGQFHAKWEDGVRQEVYTVALFIAVTRSIMAAAARGRRNALEAISAKSGILLFSVHVTRCLLTRHPRKLDAVLDQLFDRLVRRKYSRRPGRHFPRRSFKPVRKWAPTGCRRG